ncbi:MAG: fibronectin type III domain-containing protein, partial [Promethearchaeota archaeon]
ENSKGESIESNEIKLIPGTPSPPLNLNLTSDTTQIILNWNVPQTNSSYTIIKYIIYRSSTSGGPYINLANTTALSFIDTTVLEGNTYYYIVTAINSIGESENSNEVSIVIPGTTSEPTTSPSITITAQTSSATTGPSISKTTAASTPETTSESSLESITSSSSTPKRGTFFSIIAVISVVGFLAIFKRKERK